MRRRLVAVAALAVVATSCGGSPTTSPVTTTPTSTTTTPTTSTTATTPADVDLSGVQVVPDVRHDEQAAYLVDLSIPRLEGLADTTIQDTVNQTIAADIEAAVDEFVAEATTTDTTEGIKSELAVSYRVTLLDAGLYSVLVDFTEYFSGAAHPFNFVDSYLSDLATGRRLGVDDLTTSRDRLRDLIRQAVADQQYGGYRASVDEFASGQDLLDLAAFALDPDGLIVAFDQYAVAAGAAGVVTVHLDWETLAGLIPEGSPVARMLGGS